MYSKGDSDIRYTTTLRELIDSKGRLIPRDPQPGVPRVGIPRPSRVSMQDLYDRIGSMEIRQVRPYKMMAMASESIGDSLHPLEELCPRDFVLCAREEMRILLSHLIFSFPGLYDPFTIDHRVAGAKQCSCPDEFPMLSRVNSKILMQIGYLYRR
ncbi:hypothetical protein Tco_1482803 [Tanacetum coccineum]